MAKYTVELTPEEEKALKTNIFSIQDWIDNAIHNKARKVIDRIVEKSSLGSRHTSVEKKKEIIRKLDSENSSLMKTGKQKNKEMEEALKRKLKQHA